MAGDLRGQTTTSQNFVATAPVNLAYAVDMAKIKGESENDKNATAGATAGVTGQNVYLYCASAGLATVFRESVPAALAKTLKLDPGQVIQNDRLPKGVTHAEGYGNLPRRDLYRGHCIRT